MPRRPLRLLTGLAALAALLAAAPAAGAQVIEEPIEGGFASGEAAAYLALTLTPVGALAPAHDFLLRPAGPGPSGMRLHGRVGTLDRGSGVSQRTVAATLDIDVGGASFAFTGGYVDIGCDEDELSGGLDVGLDCQGGLTLDARLGRALSARSFDAAGSRRLVLGIEGTFGFSSVDLVSLSIFAQDFDVTATSQSASLALPLALVARSGTTTIAPFVAPRIAWGRTELDLGVGEDASESGVRPMLGAGVAVRVGARVGIDLGLQRVFAEDAETAFGVGVSVGF